MKYAAIILALLCFSAIPAHSQTVTAAGCTQSQINTAWANVTSATTTFVIPSCPSNPAWTAALSLAVPSGSTNLTVQGSTACTFTGTPGQSDYTGSCTDNTVIIDGDTTSGNDTVLAFTGVNNSTEFRITGISFETASGATAKNNGSFGISGSSSEIRVDHVHVVASNGNDHIFQIGGCTAGVIDHVLSSSPAGNGSENTFRFYNQGSCYSDAIGLGDQSWNHATALGTSNFFFVENSVFTNGFADDCSQGGRMVFRYNYFSESAPASSIQTHATGASARWRGCRAWEVYDNYFYPNDNNTTGTLPIYLTSGTGVIWNNTAAGISSTQGFKGLIVEHNSRNGTDYTETATPNGWGYCGTAFNGTGSNWDGNSVATTGYPCMDQVGHGIGDLLSGQFYPAWVANTTSPGEITDPQNHNQTPSPSNCTTGATAPTWNNTGGTTSDGICTWTDQGVAMVDSATQTITWLKNDLEPLYEWGNNWNNTLGWGGLTEIGGDAPFTNNQDYYAWCNAAATDGCTTAFNGTQGVGSGLLSARPSTCTAGMGGTYGVSPTGSYGVAYFATDNSTLYSCTATNTWTAIYTPYTYPHPLDTSGGGGGSTGGSTISGGSTMSGGVVLR